MKILVTGGAGFLGSHICEKYVNESEENKVICLRNFRLVNGDIRDKDLLDKLMPNVDVVFHLAAQIHVDKSIINPKDTYDTNVTGTLNVLESARTHDPKKIIIASTSEIYGPAKYNPMDENHPL